MFLLPNVPEGFVYDRNQDQQNERLMIWFAIGLAAVSIVTGILYYLYYLRVGNEVTALLPRDTVAYVNFGRGARLKETFTNLEMWENTRPVRAQLLDHERRLMQKALLDIGVTSAMLSYIERDLAELHIAVLPGDAPKGSTRRPHDILFFLKLDKLTTRIALYTRLLPHFTQDATEAGVEFHIRRTRRRGASALAMVWVDQYFVIAWGSDSSLRQILRNRERGPNRTIEDVDSFRDAFRQHGRESSFWAWARRAELTSVVVDRLIGPRLDSEKRTALAQALLLLPESDVHGIAISGTPRAGLDHGRAGFYPEGGGDPFEELAEQTGLGQMRLLSAIPAEAIFAMIVQLEDPATVFGRWGGPLLKLLGVLGAFGDNANPGATLNRLQAESGVHLTADVWPNLTREIGFALVELDGQPQWLLVANVRSTRRALSAISRLMKAAMSEGGGGSQSRYFSHENELYSIREVATWETGGAGSRDVACWTTVGSKLILAPTCAAVRMARDAEHDDAGIAQLAATARALAPLPERSTVLMLGHLRALLTLLFGKSEAFELLSDDFVAGAAVSVHADHIVLDSNLSALSLAFLWASAELDLERTHEESHDCENLEKVVCRNLSPDQCQNWRDTIGNPTPDVCETGLRTLLNLDERLKE